MFAVRGLPVSTMIAAPKSSPVAIAHRRALEDTRGEVCADERDVREGLVVAEFAASHELRKARARARATGRAIEPTGMDDHRVAGDTALFHARDRDVVASGDRRIRRVHGHA